MNTQRECDALQSRTYGLPPQMLHRAWRIEDIAGFLGIGLSKARDLMKQSGAPRRLRTVSERCDRWNASEVLAWLHHENQAGHGAEAATPSHSPSVPTHASPGRRTLAPPLPAPRATGLMATPRQRRVS